MAVKHRKEHKEQIPENKPENKSDKKLIDKLKEFYVKEYKKLFFIIIILTIFSIASVTKTYFETGDFTRRDVTLKGGISLTLNQHYNLNELEEYLKEKSPKSSFNIRTFESGGQQKGIIIEASDISDKELISILQEKYGNLGEYSIEEMGSSLGQSFFREMFFALILAFLFMGGVFHFYFRNFYATFAALFSAFLDLFFTLGVMNAIGLRLTAGGIAAYLMLIGYSVDTSILLSTKLLKEKKNEWKEGIFNAMKTGLTMSAAGIAATGISFLFTNNLVLKQIMLILIVGLIMDIITTWIGNVTFLRIYLEKNVKN